MKAILIIILWQNAFMTPQVSRPNFPRLAAGRKSVAVGNPTGTTGDMSWLPGRVPVSAQPVESDEEEEAVEDAPEEEVAEEVQAAPSVINKAVQELAFEEKVSHWMRCAVSSNLISFTGCSAPVRSGCSCRWASSTAHPTPVRCRAPCEVRAPRPERSPHDVGSCCTWNDCGHPSARVCFRRNVQYGCGR